MFLIQFKAQQAVNGMWGQRKQKTDLGSMQTHIPQEGGRSNAEDPPVTLKYGQSTLFQAGKGEK